jgi:NDP-sugar pyrophosphorylase family protein
VNNLKFEYLTFVNIWCSSPLTGVLKLSLFLGNLKLVSVKALVFAAGLGTRLQEYTQNKPKAMVEVAGKPLLEHVIKHLTKYGITDITINVFHFAGQIIEFIQRNHAFGIGIHISDERGQLLDTGGGLKKASPFLKGNEPILIYNVDVISNLDLNVLQKHHREHRALATLAVRRRNTDRCLMFDSQLQLVGWKNLSTGETRVSREEAFETARPLAFTGIHVIEPGLLDLIVEEGKFPIMDLYLRLAKNYSIKGFIDGSDLWMDLGKPDQLTAAETYFRNQH